MNEWIKLVTELKKINSFNKSVFVLGYLPKVVIHLMGGLSRFLFDINVYQLKENYIVILIVLR